MHPAPITSPPALQRTALPRARKGCGEDSGIKPRRGGGCRGGDAGIRHTVSAEIAASSPAPSMERRGRRVRFDPVLPGSLPATSRWSLRLCSPCAGKPGIPPMALNATRGKMLLAAFQCWSCPRDPQNGKGKGPARLTQGDFPLQPVPHPWHEQPKSG